MTGAAVTAGRSWIVATWPLIANVPSRGVRKTYNTAEAKKRLKSRAFYRQRNSVGCLEAHPRFGSMSAVALLRCFYKHNGTVGSESQGPVERGVDTINNCDVQFRASSLKTKAASDLNDQLTHWHS
jgi:hypothetical protein